MNEEIKIAKDIARVEGFPDYLVNKTGDVFNTSRHKSTNFKATKYVDRYGYERVWLTNKEKFKCPKCVLVHKIVLSSFSPNPDPKKFNQINHKDGNKLNNNISNLEWSNNSHNMLHKCRVLKKVNLGEKAARSKLKEVQVREIYKSTKTTKEIMEKYTISSAQVYRIKRKANWGHLNYE